MKKFFKIALVLIAVAWLGRSCLNAVERQSSAAEWKATMAASDHLVTGPLTTIIATRTPTPTYVPTATVTPTPLPVATSTSAPLPTAAHNDSSSEELAYTQAMEKYLDEYASCMDALANQFMRIGNDPSLIMDDSWKIGTASLFARLAVTNDAMRNTVPPARYADAHRYIVQAADSNDDAIAAYSDGIDNFDVNAIERGNQCVADASDSMVSATTTLQLAVYGN